MSITTVENQIAYKSARIVQLLGLTGRALSEPDNDLIVELANMVGNGTDDCDQPLNGISVGKLPRARQIVCLLPETGATIDYLRSTADGNPHWTSI